MIKGNGGNPQAVLSVINFITILIAHNLLSRCSRLG